MLKKLRFQFVAIVMASVAIVLVVVFSGICYSEYQRSMGDVREAMSVSLERISMQTGQDQDRPPLDSSQSASRHDGEPFSRSGEAASMGVGGVDPGAGQSGSYGFGPRIGGREGEGRSLVPIGVYMLSESATLEVVSGYTTALLDDNVLSSAASALEEAQDGYGSLPDIGVLYEKRSMDDAVYIAFADAASVGGWQSLALTLLIAAVVVLAVFFVIALLLSRWALKPVEDAWESQKQFVADASHELKTPLTVILANSSILLKHPEQSIANQSQWIESTQVEAESMQGLVNEMLELAQVESRAGIEHSTFDFSDMLNGQTLQFESVAFERGCSIDEAIADGIVVNGDKQRLSKMTSTLLENALKYVDEGGVVAVGLSSQANTVRLTISNTGSTISPEDLPHIFDRFYRTDKARTSGAGGFGLGLAIARETAREHGGDITCESSESKTTFTVTLPA